MIHLTRLPGIHFDDEAMEVLDRRSWVSQQLGEPECLRDSDFFVECVETFCDWDAETWREWAERVYGGKK